MVAPVTLAAYNTTLSQLYSFLRAHGPEETVFPLSIDHLSYFVMDLYNKGLSPFTITSKLSAVSYVHNIVGRPDPVASPIIKKLLYSLRKRHPRQDLRLPVTPQLLRDMLKSVKSMGFNFYEVCLFQCMFSLSFAAFLRPGEITGIQHHLQYHDVTVYQGKIMVRFAHFKHSGTPFVLTVPSEFMPFCPPALLLRFKRYRGARAGPLFIHQDGQPVSYSIYKAVFQNVISGLGLPGKYSPHSMRIGAATYAGALGFSDAQLRYFGRWRTSAGNDYVRFPM